MDDWRFESAHDIDLTPVERWRSVRREAGLLEHLTQAIFWGPMRAYLRLYHRMKVYGQEHLPDDPPFVLIANHESHLDAMLLACVLPPRLRRAVLPIAAGDVFFETPAIAAFAAFTLNALPLWRHNAGRHALRDLRERLIGEPCGYILFPAGARSRDGSLLHFKAGFGMLIAGTGVPVVPCYLDGPFRALPPKSKLPRPRRLAVWLGEPLRFGDVPGGRAGWEEIASRAEEAVLKLRSNAEAAAARRKEG
jgi:1-acyl-sn-glycerol-3-phosphate acyltransferase